MERLYYGIAEVASELGVSIATLRFWETEFPQIKPNRNKRGVRFYTKDNIEIFKHIHYLTKTCGYTIEGAKNYMKTEKVIAKNNTQPYVEVVRTLTDIKNFLLELKKTL